MNPQPITIAFLSRSHEIPAYDAEGLEYRIKLDSQLSLRLYRLNRGWMARLDVAAFDTYTQSQRQETAQAAIDEIEGVLAPIAFALSPLLPRVDLSEPPSCDEPTVPMSEGLLAEALQGG